MNFIAYRQRPNNRLAGEALLMIFDAFLPPSHERGRSNDSNEHTASMSLHGNKQRLHSAPILKCFAKLEDMNEIVRSLSYRGVFDRESVRLLSQIIFRFATKNSQNHREGVELAPKQGKTWTQQRQLHLCRPSVGQNLQILQFSHLELSPF